MNKVVTIRVDRGKTINLGDYNSVRLNISIEASCNEEDVEDKYDELSDWVYNKLENESEIYK